MKKATITETKNHLSALIHAVRQGETVIIMDRTKPVARIEAVTASSVEDEGGRLDRLQREGILLRPGKVNWDSIVETAPPRPLKAASAVEALLVDRREGR